jgi:SAM-dependent methyltransferase
VGLARLLVPLDPWRYYELGRVADEEFGGYNLDVSSPKLLASLLGHERRGTWVGTDLCDEEVAGWRCVDPGLRLAVCDATRLPFADATFDHCVCLSVVEHIHGDGDARAMAEMWRVLRPGGRLYLTTNVAAEPRDVFIARRIYGAGSTAVGGRVFFERHYSPAQLRERLLRQPWEVLDLEYARQEIPYLESVFYALRPWSYPCGSALRWLCPNNFRVGRSPAVLPERGHGVVYLKLRKPC